MRLHKNEIKKKSSKLLEMLYFKVSHYCLQIIQIEKEKLFKRENFTLESCEEENIFFPKYSKHVPDGYRIISKKC